MPRHEDYYLGKEHAYRTAYGDAYLRMRPALRHIRRQDTVKAERSLVRLMNRLCRMVKEIEDRLDIPDEQRLT